MSRVLCRLVPILLILLLSSCVRPVPPETAHLIYELTKTLNPNCGQNILCVDFEGLGKFGQSCTDEDFSFDNSAWMNITVATQMLFPGNQVNLELVQYGKSNSTVQKWDFSLVPPATAPQGQWSFWFRVNPSGKDLPLKSLAQVKGTYMLSVLGGAQTVSADLTIHAEKDVVGHSAALCSVD
jgi:hypothetical protein